MTFEESVPAEIREEWESMLAMRGMAMLRARCVAGLDTADAGLRSDEASSMEKVAKLRGMREAFKQILAFTKEQRRAAKSQTPAETEE